MKRELRVVGVLAFLLVAACGGVCADELLDSAEAFFKSYVDGGNKAASFIVDYISDDARIVTLRHTREGETYRIETTGVKHKKFLKKMRLHARVSKITSRTVTSFSDITYKPEDGCVRITASRHVEPKGTVTPYSLLVCKDEGNEWRIKEELVEIKEVPDAQP